MISSRARVAFVLFAISLVAGQISGRDFFYNLAYAWGALLVVTFVWSRLALRGVQIMREPRSNRAQVGQLFVERFRLTNASRIPKLWIEASDDSELPGYRVTTLAVGLGFRGPSQVGAHRAVTVTVGLGPFRSRSWLLRTLCTQRGRFRLGPLTLRSGDPFGFFPMEREVSGEQHIVVLPMIEAIPDFALPSGRLPGGEALRRRTHQVTPNASGVREYMPGDSFSRIHWKSTARRQRLIVKEFELDPLAEIWIVLDACSADHYRLSEEVVPEPGEGAQIRLPPATEEYGIAAAASLIYHFLQRDRAVGLITYGDARYVIQPETGQAQLFRLLENLAVLKVQGELRLDEVLKVEGARIPQDATAILITASAEPRVLSAVQRLSHSGRQPALVLLEASSFGGPEGAAALVDGANRSGVPVRLLRNGDRLAESLGVRRNPIPLGRAA